MSRPAASPPMPSMPRARAPGVFAASLASRWVRRIPAAPVVAGVRTFAAALVYPSRWRPPSSSPLSAIVLFDCCVAAVVGEAPRCTCRRSLVPLAPRRPRRPAVLLEIDRCPARGNGVCLRSSGGGARGPIGFSSLTLSEEVGCAEGRFGHFQLGDRWPNLSPKATKRYNLIRGLVGGLL